MSFSDTGVFERTGSDDMSDRACYTLLAIFVACGLAATAFSANYAIEIGYAPTKWDMIGVGVVIPIIGILIAKVSENWFVSFIGYNLITIPFGFVLAPMLRQYDPHIVRNVCAQTALITSVMGFAGMTFPSVFRNMGGYLFVALLSLVLASIVQIFVPAWQGATWVNYVAVIIFTLYIGFDFFRASEVPRTADNAVDIAVSIYLDIINLFIRLLALSKRD